MKKIYEALDALMYIECFKSVAGSSTATTPVAVLDHPNILFKIFEKYIFNPVQDGSTERPFLRAAGRGAGQEETVKLWVGNEGF